MGKINFSYTEGLIPEGVHMFTIVDARLETSKSGKLMIRLELQPQDERYEDQRVTDYIMLEKYLSKKRAFCKAKNIRELEYDDDTKIFPDIIGEEIGASVGFRDFNGTLVNDIKTYISPDLARELVNKEVEVYD